MDIFKKYIFFLIISLMMHQIYSMEMQLKQPPKDINDVINYINQQEPVISRMSGLPTNENKYDNEIYEMLYQYPSEGIRKIKDFLNAMIKPSTSQDKDFASFQREISKARIKKKLFDICYDQNYFMILLLGSAYLKNHNLDNETIGKNITRNLFIISLHNDNLKIKLKNLIERISTFTLIHAPHLSLTLRDSMPKVKNYCDILSPEKKDDERLCQDYFKIIKEWFDDAAKEIKKEATWNSRKEKLTLLAVALILGGLGYHYSLLEKIKYWFRPSK